MSRLWLFWLVTVICLGGGAVRADDAVFARVGVEEIARAELEVAVKVTARQRFYHGRMSDERQLQLRREVAGNLIDRILLRQEAGVRGLTVSGQQLKAYVAHELQRYSTDQVTPEQLKHLELMLQQQAKNELLLAALKEDVLSAVEIKEADVASFYKDNIEKFTTPMQQRVSVILLKVAPSAPVSAWDAAEAEGKKIKARLDKGADFGELARLHSGDASAESGGDMGFIHQGMLSQEAQAVVDTLKVGEVSEPLVMLQGVAIFHLTGVKDAIVNPLVSVRERAEGLLKRQLNENAWQALLVSLRSKAAIEIFDSEITTKTIWANELVANGQ